jgi:hypothetical protein
MRSPAFFRTLPLVLVTFGAFQQASFALGGQVPSGVEIPPPAVGELEGAVDVSCHWRVELMLGGLLWGAGVPSTYGERVELTIRYRF